MKLSLFLSSLLAGAALAAPRTVRRSRPFSHQSHPAGAPKPSNELEVNEGASYANYSSNWAGAVLVGSGYTSVTGQFKIPQPSPPPGADGSTQYCAAAWVGLDGDTCQSAILQTGVDFCIQGSQTSLDAWYEWFPDAAYNFDGISFNVGDEVKVSVEASSKSTGTATVENLSSGQTVHHTFSGGTQGNLCETNAEWIVEDFESGGSEVPLVNFGSVTFTSASASDGGSTVDTSGSTILDMRQQGKVITSSSASGGNVTVKYTNS